MNRQKSETFGGIRVQMIIGHYYPFKGGAESQAKLLAEHLVKRGCCVNVLTDRLLKNTLKKESINGVKILRLGRAQLLRVPGAARLRYYLFSLKVFLYLLLNHTDYDIIHVHQIKIYSYLACIAGILVKKPVFIKPGTSGGKDDYDSLIALPLDPVKYFAKGYFKRFANIVVMDSKMYGDFIALGFNKDNIRVIPNGVLIGVKHKSDYETGDLVKLISVGFIIPHKAQNLTVEAIERIDRYKYDYRIYGRHSDQEYARELQGKVKAANLKGHDIKLMGEVEKPILLEALVDSDIMIHSSYFEGMSNAILEAMGAGLPCISTLVSGVADMFAPELEDPTELTIGKGEYYLGECGIIVNTGDTVGIAAALTLLSSDKGLRMKLGANARKRIIDCFSIDYIAGEYIKYYEFLLGKNPN